MANTQRASMTVARISIAEHLRGLSNIAGIIPHKASRDELLKIISDLQGLNERLKDIAKTFRR